MQPQEFTDTNNGQISSAGPRYTPGMDPNAPNLEIAPIALLTGALTQNEYWVGHVERLREQIAKANEYPPEVVRLSFRGRANTVSRVQALLGNLAAATSESARPVSESLQRATESVARRLREVTDDLRARQPENDEERRQVDSDLHSARKIADAIGDVSRTVNDMAFKALRNRKVLLLGEWGTGKTHFLCDFVRNRANRSHPTLFFLAQNLAASRDPLQALCDQTGLAATPTALFDRLDQLGRSHGARAFLAIDGINEGDRGAWKRGLERLTALVDAHPHVTVVLSCRRPFEDQVFSRRKLRQWTTAIHPGFADIEFDAQIQYFTYYDVPVPHVPLLAPEFSRPLFLKILCETIRDLAAGNKRKYLRDLGSGQKGMTRVLEDFVKTIGAKIERDLALPSLSCWKLLKGSRFAGSPGLVGLAPIMAQELREYVTLPECFDAIRAVTGLRRLRDCKRLLSRLTADGLLLPGARWQSPTVYEEVIRLPYERFSDHLIARHLMERYLSTNSESAIRRSFYSNRPLGKVFDVAPRGWTFAKPGWATAIMLEFPERVKRQLPADNRELAYFLPKKRRLAQPLRDVFLDGLEWRSTGSFGDKTDHLVGFYLRKAGEEARKRTFEVLVALATRPGHPYSAARLYGNLARETMADRDLTWSEYIRALPDDATVFRLLKWLEQIAERSIEPSVARSIIQLLAPFLTTTRRGLRDGVTRTLVLLGKKNPRALFDVTISALTFNDPYVPERMLAACYGVAMRYWKDPAGTTVRRQLPRLARDLAAKMFVPPAPNGTRHVLVQDYALGVIELAQKVKPGCIPRRQRRHLRRPLNQIRTPFPNPDAITDAEVEAVRSVMHMDFNNYTLGRLVANRRNYDDTHIGYRDVRKQVLWRVASLGYSEAAFKEIDQSISRAAWDMRENDRERVDRYGKKYSWIAYFEQWGVRLDEHTLPEWRSESRPSEVDIDPSFPKEPRSWHPELLDVFTNAPTDLREWIASGPVPDYGHLLERDEVDGIRGPWVLIDGFVEQATGDGRQVFTFLRGIGIAASRASRVINSYNAVDYPGNAGIPEMSDDHYTFAGEIPWSRRFGEVLRTRSGKSRRYISKAFSRFVGRREHGTPVEVLSHRFGWESYHSSMNQVSGALAPSPSLCDASGLINHSEQWDLFDRHNKPATLYRECKDENATYRSYFLYMRAGLLRKYLRENKEVLVWFPWGERTLTTEMFNARRDEIEDLFQHYLEIHRSCRKWSG